MTRTMTKANADEQNRVLSELLETAIDLSKHGLLAKSDMAAVQALCKPPPIFSASRVQQIRLERARMSQTVFAAFLNVSVSAVQKWESPESGKHPQGSAAKLLQLIEARGVEAIFL